ncbi:hemolysin family protein [Blautia sp. CLA-JM-H16]|uniref:Hemolysin family protein n=1 Tax=Blautia aquisgranensis TaxID=3133153 RepID=A0ABV1BBE3_9FIRM
MIQAIILLVVLIFLNSVFAGAEIAVLSMNEPKMKELAEGGDHRAQILMKISEQPAHFMTAIRVTVTTAGFLQSAFAAEYFAQPMAAALLKAGVDIPQNVLKVICMIIVTVLLSYVSLLFGELVPRRLGMKNADELSLRLAGLLHAVLIAVWPVTVLLTATANGVLRLMGIRPEEKEEQVTEEEIRMMISEGNEQGNIQQEESEMIRNVFDLDDTTADEICTHRRDVVVLYMEDPDEKWEETIRANRHTCYPVCGENQDDIVYILDTRDYFRLNNRTREAVLKEACYPPFLVPESMRANLIFREMREKRDYFAAVLDEYGCFVGIVTLHDLVETLVGDIDDRTDLPKPDDIEKTGEHVWRVQGGAILDDVAEAMDVELPVEKYDTFSGFVCGVLERVPEDGEKFRCHWKNLDIVVDQVRNHTVAEGIVHVRSEKKVI